MGIGTVIAQVLGGGSPAALLAALFPAPHVVASAGATQTLTFDAGARETVWDVTMAANTAFTIDTTNMVVGASIKLILRQDATAGRTPTLPPKAAWPNGSVPVANTAAGKHDVFYFDSDDGVGVDGSVRTLGSLTPALPAAPSIAVAASNAQNVITVTDGAANGSAITAHKMYRGTTAGAEALIGTVTLGAGNTYTDTGLANGTTYYYKFTALNGVGESLPSAEASATPSNAPTAPAHYLNLTGTKNANSFSGNRETDVATDGFYDLDCWIKLQAYAAASGSNSFLISRYNSSNASISEFFFGLNGTAGYPVLAYYDPSGTFKGCVGSAAVSSSADVSSSLGVRLRCIINATAAAVTTTLTPAGQTSPFVAQPGTCTFFTAPGSATSSGAIWTQLGSAQTAGTAGIRNSSTSSITPAVGSNDTSNSALTGAFYQCTAKNSAGAILFNPDYTAQPSGSATFNDTAATPNAWGFYQAAAA